MKKSNRKWRKALIITLVSIAVVIGGGYLALESLKTSLVNKISGCNLENKNFEAVIDFELVNNWIVVQAKVGGSEKEYPFIFDTGAQTVILDRLMDEIGEDNFDMMSFNQKEDSSGYAFNNELATLKSLQLGDVQFSDIGSLTAKNAKWGMLNCISAYGIIGCNILQTCSFQIDYEAKQITLTDKVENLENYGDISWVQYEPISTQESPIIPAIINDSIKVNLLFDTGMSGGITLYSEEVYYSFKNNFPENSIHIKSRPSLLIRGEANVMEESLKYEAPVFTIGDIQTKNIRITVMNQESREYSGLIGNDYFKNFSITVDYQNRRIGFIPTHQRQKRKGSFGISYKAVEDKMIVSAVYKGYAPDLAGIEPGDEIHSINGIVIPDLASETFCEIYRKEYLFGNPQDSILQMEIRKGDSYKDYKFNMRY